MGNALSPNKTFNSSSGNSSRLEFAANQITGWRRSQEDRYVSLPNFTEDFSLFAVYDGHGGEDVVQYLERFLHQFILKELELTRDVELALYLSFLNCDSSLRSISNSERDLIKSDLFQEIRIQVPNQAERRKVLFGSVDAAGTSGVNQVDDDFRAAIACELRKELPKSISYLAQAPMQESDESDKDYIPGDEDVNFLSNEQDVSDDQRELSDSSESIEDDTMEIYDEEEKVAENSGKTNKKILSESWKKALNEDKDLNKKIGYDNGSTATVLLINDKRLYIAYVGDSRCVACIKGCAVDLTTDHRPTDNDEMDRILSAGGIVSEDGRIFGDIDMSRAFGDFRYKTVQNPLNILSVEPSISSLEITPDLEFIIVASDGIWNSMSSVDVVDYIHRRISDPSLELQDLCGELFEEMLPEEITSDGSGCDNMTAIIIKFKCSQGLNHNYFIQEIYQYNYPPVNSKLKKSSTEENIVTKEVEGKEIPQSNLDEIKDCDGKNQLNLNDIINDAIVISDSNEESEEYEYGFGGKKEEIETVESSQESKENYESGSRENDAKCESDNKLGIEENSNSSENSIEFLEYVERIPTNKKQQLNTSNVDHSDFASLLAARPDQQAMSPSESTKENSAFPEEQLQNSPQLEENDDNSNLLQNSHQNYDYDIINNPLQHGRNMCRVIESLNFTRRSVQELHSKLSHVEQVIYREIRRFNSEHLDNFPYQDNLNSSEAQPPVSVGLVDLTEENGKRNKQGEVLPQIESVVIQSPQSPSMQMETDIINIVDKNRLNAEQSVENNKCVDNEIVQSPIMQMEAEFTDLHSKKMQTPKQSASKKIVPKHNINAFESSNLQILKSPVNTTNEKMLNPEPPGEKDEVADSATIQSLAVQIETTAAGQSGENNEAVGCAVMQSPSVQNVTNVVDIANDRNESVKTDEVQANESVSKNEEEVIRDLCNKNIPTKGCDDFNR